MVCSSLSTGTLRFREEKSIAKDKWLGTIEPGLVFRSLCHKSLLYPRLMVGTVYKALLSPGPRAAAGTTTSKAPKDTRGWL